MIYAAILLFLLITASEPRLGLPLLALYFLLLPSILRLIRSAR